MMRAKSPGGFGAAIYYSPKHFDIQILNSLIFFCVAGFIVRFAQRILAMFSSSFEA